MEIPDFVRRHLEREALEQETNPRRFPHHAQIIDDVALLLLAQYSEVIRQEEIARCRQQEAEAKTAAVKARVFAALLDLHPDVRSIEHPHTGIRKSGEDYYYVSY